MRRLAWRCLTAIAITAVAQTASAQDPAQAQIDSLRTAAQAHPDSFPMVLAYGQALARAATERSDDWRRRAEARKVLDDAIKLRGDDPRPYLEAGLLLRKQGSRTDAMRVLERAEDRAAKAGAQMSPADQAELHLQMALIYEVWWEDGEHLGLLPDAFVRGNCPHLAAYFGPGYMPASTPKGNLLAYNVACPDMYDELMSYWTPLEGQNEDDFDAMIRHFRAAMAADPSDGRAASRLLRHLAASDSWEEFLEVAEPLARRRPTDPDALLFLGLGYHATGRSERADSAFGLAIEQADPDLRRDMLQPEQLLRRQDSTSFSGLPATHQDVLTDVFWRARDPLFLSGENERLAEHLARFAYVEVAYSVPQSGLRGRWSERGAAWLRWGRPLQLRVVRYEDSRLLEFWDYGKGSPDLVFERTRTYRWARYEELSAEYVRYAREHVPEIYAPEHPRVVGTVPFQAAAFRDTAGGAVLEVYAELATDVLRSESDVPEIETGIFVATGDFWEPRGALRGTLTVGEPTRTLDAAFTLPPGSYVVSVEATAGDVAAKERERVDVPAFGDSLALSDLLLVERFSGDTIRVDDRRQLVSVVSRTRRFLAGTPIGVVWEIYGLRADSTGVVRYRVQADVTDEVHKSALVRVVRGLFGGGPPPSGLAWNASRVPRPDGTVVEYLSFDLPKADPGSYRAFITVTDLVTGRSFTVHRGLAITKP